MRSAPAREDIHCRREAAAQTGGEEAEEQPRPEYAPHVHAHRPRMPRHQRLHLLLARGRADRVSLVNVPLKAVPVPLLPAESMKYSAALMLPLPALLTVALIVGGVVVGLGDTRSLEVVGPAAPTVQISMPLTWE